MCDLPGLGLLHPSLPRLARYLRVARPLLEKQLRADGAWPMPPDVVALLDVIEALASCAAVSPERSSGTPGTPGLPDREKSLTLPTMSTAEAAEQTGTSERAIRARLARGTLAGHKAGRTWRVDALALTDLARRRSGGAA